MSSHLRSFEQPLANIECYGCGEKGHKRINCPFKGQGHIDRDQRQYATEKSKNFGIEEQQEGRKGDTFRIGKGKGQGRSRPFNTFGRKNFVRRDSSSRYTNSNGKGHTADDEGFKGRSHRHPSDMDRRRPRSPVSADGRPKKVHEPWRRPRSRSQERSRPEAERPSVAARSKWQSEMMPLKNSPRLKPYVHRRSAEPSDTPHSEGEGGTYYAHRDTDTSICLCDEVLLDKKPLQRLLQRLEQSVNTLEELELGYCVLPDEGIMDILDTIARTSTLCRLSIPGLLRESRKGAALLRRFLELCVQNPGLAALDLSDAPVAEEGFKGTALMLKDLRRLERLALANCKLPRHAMLQLKDALAGKALAALDFSNNLPRPCLEDDAMEVLCDLIKAQPALTTLDVSGCDLSRCMATFANAVRGHPSLTDLVMKNTSLNERSIEAFGGALQHQHCRLQVVSLQQAGVDDGGLQQLAWAAKWCDSLCRLDLEGNLISKKAITDVEQMVQRNTTLLALHLRGNPVFKAREWMADMNRTLMRRIVWRPSTHRFFTPHTRDLLRIFLLIAERRRLFSRSKGLANFIFPFFPVNSDSCSLVDAILLPAPGPDLAMDLDCAHEYLRSLV